MSKKLIEAALFMASRPLSAEEIARITAIPAASVEKRLGELQREYAEKGVEVIRSLEGWHMRVKPDLLPKVAHLTPYSDLKDGHKRTLALIVYREPARQSDIVHIQGNKVYNYIKFLRRKGLVKAEKEGRTVKLTVTKEFERYFGLERAKIRAMLHQAMEAEKAKAAAGAIKAEIKPLPVQAKAEEKATTAAIAKREEKAAVAKTGGAKAAAKKVSGKRKRVTPAGKIGVRRPGR
jgi:segregation and condensation protein B